MRGGKASGHETKRKPSRNHVETIQKTTNFLNHLGAGASEFTNTRYECERGQEWQFVEKK
jgi:hypothetical protein